MLHCKWYNPYAWHIDGDTHRNMYDTFLRAVGLIELRHPSHAVYSSEWIGVPRGRENEEGGGEPLPLPSESSKLPPPHPILQTERQSRVGGGRDIEYWIYV